MCSNAGNVPSSEYSESELKSPLQSCIRPSASRSLWSTCSSVHAHNAPSIFSQLLSSLIPIMSQNRICKILGPHSSGKTTLLQCYAKHVASSHAQVPAALIVMPPRQPSLSWHYRKSHAPSSHCSNLVNSPGSTAFGFLMPVKCVPSRGNISSLVMP